MGAGERNDTGRMASLFVQYVVFLFFRMMEGIICLIPRHEKSLALGRFFGRLMFLLGSERRAVAVENLGIAFGTEKSADEIRLLARQNFEHLGMLGVEFFRMRRWSHDELVERLIFEGHDNYNLAWSPGRLGVYYITAHFGSFEVLAAMARFLGIRGNLVVTPAPNRFVNDRMFFQRGGTSTGLRTLPHRGVVHRLIELLSEGDMVVVLGDQRGDDNRPTWVNFFGTRVLANGVFAKLAMEGNALTFPVMARRTQDGKYRCMFGDEIPISVTGDLERDLAVNSQRFHEVYENWLRECPEQGFWMHRKFKRKLKKRKSTGLAKRHRFNVPSHG
jgi:Kdo2-lipid IVA lauroyltransferase/acyltransferase